MSSCAQLVVLVRCVPSGDIKDNFSFCHARDTATKADDGMRKVLLPFFPTSEACERETCEGFVRTQRRLCAVKVRIRVESEEVGASSQGHPLHDPQI